METSAPLRKKNRKQEYSETANGGKENAPQAYAITAIINSPQKSLQWIMLYQLQGAGKLKDQTWCHAARSVIQRRDSFCRQNGKDIWILFHKKKNSDKL